MSRQLFVVFVFSGLLLPSAQAQQMAALAVPGVTPRADIRLLETAEEPTTYGYLRMDAESPRTPEFEFAITHPFLGQEIMTAVSMAETFGQIDIGPTLSFGAFEMTPMVGVGVDLAAGETSNIDTKIYSALELSSLYGEFWLFGSWEAPFVADPTFSIYSQNFLLYQANDYFGIGPQAEATICVRGCAGDPEGILSLPVGGRANFTLGNNEVGMFVGYNSQIPSAQDGFLGRLTLIRSF